MAFLGEIKVVDEPQGGIRSCIRCGCNAGDSVGPFVSLGVKVVVPTANGRQEIEQLVYICVGNEGRPGCFANAVSFAGGLNAWEATAEREAHTATVEELMGTVAELQEKLAALSQPQMVSVQDLVAAGVVAGLPSTPSPTVEPAT